MTFSPERCPLCGQPNECQLATQAECEGACWCKKEIFPPELLARVPGEARGCACICQRCLAEAQRAEKDGGDSRRPAMNPADSEKPPTGAEQYLRLPESA